MSKDYSFTSDLSATIGHGTKKSDYDSLTENTNEIDQRLEALPYFGGFLPLAGSYTVSRDGSNRISTVTYKNSSDTTIATMTVSYDDGNGGRVEYVEVEITDPVATTIRETFSYDGSNNVTGSTRTVS
ncbi:MAG: hypothetical protein AVO39_11055 [delta proteobacterium MLS_D]|nr:MAG: hypothetical protein AVO39_11055 [delta proteobacterium MLS_D]